MKHILHLSDLHIGAPNTLENFEQIASNLIRLKSPAENYVVVITGNLVNDASVTANFELVSTQLERLDQAGFHVLMCPGNHDVGTGMAGSKTLLEQWNKHFLGQADITYPIVDIIDDIAFIGLNSMAEELNWHDRFAAQGELGDDQLDRLQELLNSPTVKNAQRRVVYLHHNPFDYKMLRGLKDAKDLRRVLLYADVHALLFGHNLDGDIYKSEWNIPFCTDAGTSTFHKHKRSQHRVIDLSDTSRPKWYDACLLRSA